MIPVAASRTLQDNFNIYCPIAEGIPDHPWGAPITVSTYIPSLQKLVCGYKDGRIITVPALHAAKARLLAEGSVQKGEQLCSILLYFTTRGGEALGNPPHLNKTFLNSRGLQGHGH